MYLTTYILRRSTILCCNCEFARKFARIFCTFQFTRALLLVKGLRLPTTNAVAAAATAAAQHKQQRTNTKINMFRCTCTWLRGRARPRRRWLMTRCVCWSLRVVACRVLAAVWWGRDRLTAAGRLLKSFMSLNHIHKHAPSTLVPQHNRARSTA